MVFKSTRIGNSFFDEMKDRIEVQVWFDRANAYGKYEYDAELKDELDMIDDWYNFNLSKLDELAALQNQSVEVQGKFISQKAYIEGRETLEEKRKIEAILTTAVILNGFGEFVLNMSEIDLFWLSCNLRNTELKKKAKYRIRIHEALSNPIDTKESSFDKAKQFTITMPKETK